MMNKVMMAAVIEIVKLYESGRISAYDALQKIFLLLEDYDLD